MPLDVESWRTYWWCGLPQENIDTKCSFISTLMLFLVATKSSAKNIELNRINSSKYSDSMSIILCCRLFFKNMSYDWFKPVFSQFFTVFSGFFQSQSWFFVRSIFSDRLWSWSHDPNTKKPDQTKPSNTSDGGGERNVHITSHVHGIPFWQFPHPFHIPSYSPGNREWLLAVNTAKSIPGNIME